MSVTGQEVRRAFRRNRITIREAAAILDAPQKRIRQYYRHGTDNPVIAWELLEFVPQRARERRRADAAPTP